MTALEPVLSLPGAVFTLQALASLAAILALAWLARKLQLGADPRIASEAHARELADEALCGFDPETLSIDRAGIGAIARDRLGRVLLIRQHGCHFASRQLTNHDGVRLDGRFLTLSTDDPRFGKITLDLGDQAQVWAASLRRLGALRS